MGISKLATFVKENGLFKYKKLHDTRVIMDGNGLVKWLHCSQENGGIGGNYKDFEATCIEFFKAMERCNIKPYIVYDGAINDKRLDLTMGRVTGRIREYSKIIKNGRGSILSGFTYDVFNKVAEDHHIPFLCCNFEADGEVVALANAWGCPVIGEDSDFLIFDIKGGYIPRTSVKWKKMIRRTTMVGSSDSHSCISADIYYQRDFCDRFHIQCAVVPVIAGLFGNDYISRDITSKFHHSISHIETPGKDNSKFSRALKWLQQYDTCESAINKISEVSGTRSNDIKERLEEAIQMYQYYGQSTLRQYFEEMDGRGDLDTLETLLSHMTIQSDVSFPQWFMVLFKRGKIQPGFINLVNQRRSFTHLFIEDNRQLSCHKVSLPIRKAMYGILLETPLYASLGVATDDLDPMACIVEEIDRRSHTESLETVHVSPLTSLETFGPLPNLVDIPSLSDDKRKSLLMEIMGSTPSQFESLPSELHIPLAVTIYWMKNAEPPVSEHHMMGLLYYFVRRQPSRLSKQACQQPCVSPSSETGDRVAWKFIHICQICLDVVHACAQWQSCMQYALYLNTLLQEAYPTPDMTDLFHGSEISAIYHRIVRPPRERIEQYLQSEKMQEFDRLYSVVRESGCVQSSSGRSYASHTPESLHTSTENESLGQFDVPILDLAGEETRGATKTTCRVGHGSVPKFGRRDHHSHFEGHQFPMFPSVQGQRSDWPNSQQSNAQSTQRQSSTRRHTQPTCYNCGKSGHKSPKCQNKKNQCRNCSRFGHLARFCHQK